LVLGSFDDKLCLCDWHYRKMRSAVDGRISRGLNAEFIESDATVLRETKRQLDEYFRAERKRFELPLLMVGSDFQKRVWDELLNVEYGETASYLGLAERMGNKNAVRAVAGANGANAISIIVPCHRIIGGKGELVGYAGGLKAKEKLLALECGLFALR
jgi:methylated-DNA-[protein]-cysteine S-methyltransferase